MENQDIAAMREALKRFEAQVDRLESLLQKQQAGDQPKSIDDQLRIMQRALEKQEYERSKPDQYKRPWYLNDGYGKGSLAESNQKRG